MGTRHWSRQIIHCPTRLENNRLFFVDIMKNECALTKFRNKYVKPASRTATRSTFKAIKQTLLILIGL